MVMMFYGYVKIEIGILFFLSVYIEFKFLLLFEEFKF